MSRLNEREIINIFAAKLGIDELDDLATATTAAVGGKNNSSNNRNYSCVLKCDMLVSSTDVPPQMKPWQIARKSVVSCASDFAAKGIQPEAAMLSLGIPAGSSRSFVKGLADGFARASKEFGVKIVGGDTNEAAELVIDCCMVGFSEKRKRMMPTRSGAKPGDIVVVSGKFGLPPSGLAILLKGAHPRVSSGSKFARRAVDSVLQPSPRQDFGMHLARYFSASIDSSDGLAISLYELARKSNRVDIAVDSILPVADGVEDFAAENGLDAAELVLHGGEEYEIVATIPKAKFGLARSAARRAGLGLHAIGAVVKGSGTVRVGGKPLEDRGYTHFAPR